MSSRVRIEINEALCKHCKMCTKACYEDVFRWDEEAEKPIAAYPEDCVACLACEAACSADCIEIVPQFPVPLPSPF